MTNTPEESVGTKLPATAIPLRKRVKVLAQALVWAVLALGIGIILMIAGPVSGEGWGTSSWVGLAVAVLSLISVGLELKAIFWWWLDSTPGQVRLVWPGHRSYVLPASEISYATVRERQKYATPAVSGKADDGVTNPRIPGSLRPPNWVLTLTPNRGVSWDDLELGSLLGDDGVMVPFDNWKQAAQIEGKLRDAGVTVRISR